MGTVIPVSGTRHDADFDTVRTIRSYALGWATVSTEEVTLRFPAILHKPSGAVMTVADWQAPDWAFYDLSDPLSVRDMIRTGAGKFIRPGTGNDSIVANHFALPVLRRRTDVRGV